MKPERFISPKEAAEILGISTRTIRRAVEAGELRAMKYNSRVWRLDASDVAAWHSKKVGRCPQLAQLAQDNESGS